MTNTDRSDETPDKSAAPDRSRSSSDRGTETTDDAMRSGPFTADRFFSGLAEGTLLGGRCKDCETMLVPPRPACYACGGRNVDVEDQGRNGTIISHTLIRKAAPAFEELAPFPVAIVELESGARMPGRVDAPYEQITIGDDVHVEIREPTDADQAFALDHENAWPIHVFVPK